MVVCLLLADSIVRARLAVSMGHAMLAVTIGHAMLAFSWYIVMDSAA